MEILILFVLTLLNGFFALSEIALVSVKKSRIEHLAAQGSSRAKTILALLENPEGFLSSVQVGITLIGIVAGAYGGAKLTDDLEHYLLHYPAIAPYAHNVAMIFVIGCITYFTIVIGELVPKTIAMNNAESIALNCAKIIKYFTMATYPFVKLLSFSTQLIMRIFGVKINDADQVSEEELRFMIKTAGKQGVLETQESQVHQNLFSFTDQTAKSLMTHSSDVEWIDITEDKETIYLQLKESAHSKFIVSEGVLDNIKGVVYIKDFLEQMDRDDFDMNKLLKTPIFVTQNTPAFHLINTFKNNKQYMAVVVDEFGSVKGIVTLHDLFEAIIGDLPDEDERDELFIFKRNDNTYLIDGKTLIHEINQFFQKEIIEDNQSKYTTISGFMIEHLKRIPAIGDKVEVENLVFEIMDMDKVRIDKVLLTIKAIEAEVVNSN